VASTSGRVAFGMVVVSLGLAVFTALRPDPGGPPLEKVRPAPPPATGAPSDSALERQVRALMMAQQYGRARGVLQDALRREPRDHEARLLYAELLLQERNLDECVVELNMLAESGFRPAAVHRTLGRAWSFRGDLRRAVSHFERCLALDERDALCRRWLADACLDLGNAGQAVREYEKALSYAPGDAQIFKSLGLAYRTMNRLDEAVAAYREAVSLAPRDPAANNDLARILAVQGRMDEAVAQLDRAIAVLPNEQVLRAVLRPAPGEVYGDIGCGSGRFTFVLAKWVGPRGKVYAIDVDPLPLKLVDGYIRRRGVRNVEIVRSKPREIGIPDGSLDRALIINVYNHVAEAGEATTRAWIASVVRTVKPGGKILVIDSALSRAMPVAHLKAHGFRLEREEPLREGGYVLLFTRSG